VSTLEPLDNPLNRVLKRLLDIGVALPVVCLVLPPLTLVVWLMQRWQSPGPVFYRQLRSGLNRERFSIYKFRTMRADDARACAQQATATDSRVYAFGRFLRRSSLDEVPQFLNVILGTMSVSGPRPHLLEHDEQFGRLEHAYFKRHFVKPGITGLAQSKGFRGELLVSSDLANRVHYDELYVANWSLGLDLSILLHTVRQVISPPRSAY
jgi:lipopolysaccharide/colanic/teichoic acid biosynthesis glycosyltransferase